MSILFIRTLHPLSTGIVLLMQTTVVSLAAGALNKTFWFSYILFLIFLGGMLVLFIYVASLASNEQFGLNLTAFALAFVFILASMLLLIMIDPIVISNKTAAMISSIAEHYKIGSASLYNSPIYNTPSAFLTFFIISYLLLALLVVRKIIKSSQGSLRLSS